MIEAITNSLQANANVIKVYFALDNQKEFDGKQKINSFSIKNDGNDNLKITKNDINDFSECKPFELIDNICDDKNK